jgi:hypothetical protein
MICLNVIRSVGTTGDQRPVIADHGPTALQTFGQLRILMVEIDLSRFSFARHLSPLIVPEV